MSVEPESNIYQELIVGLHTVASIPTGDDLGHVERHQYAIENIGTGLAAVAYEIRQLRESQDTANLLTLYKHVEYQGDMPDHATELFSDIADRMNLRGDNGQ